MTKGPLCQERHRLGHRPRAMPYNEPPPRSMGCKDVHLPTWSEASDFVRAVAELLRALQWPLVALIITHYFRGDIQKLLLRVRRGSLFGAEVELAQALDLLEEGTEPQDALAQPSPSDARDGETMLPDGSREDEDLERARTAAAFSKEQDILRTAAISPRAALMLLSSEIESTLRRLATDDEIEGQLPRYTRPPTVSEMARDLTKTGTITERTEDNIANLWRARNLVVHEGQGEDDDILRALDSGLLILRNLTALDPDPQEPAESPRDP
jgi:hypothetical protein